MAKTGLIDLQTEYIERIQAGARQLIPELWELLRPLTATYIRRYIMREQGERLFDEGDLWQESYIALVAALDYYKPDAGTSFAGVYLWTLNNATRATRGTISRDAIFRAGSLDVPLDESGEGDTTRGDMVEDTNAGQPYEDVERAEYLRQIRQAFAEIDAEQLTPEQRTVIQARYYDGFTLKQTSELLRVSSERCRVIENSALRVYRRPQNSEKLEGFCYDCMKGVGLTAYRQRQASVVELAIERLDRLESIRDKLRPERRQRLQRERELLEKAKRWGEYQPPEFIRQEWAAYIAGETDEAPSAW